VESVTGVPPPVPVRFTTWGPLGPLSVNVSAPLNIPTAFGENLTPIVQVAPAARLGPQVLLATVKLPMDPMLEKVTGTLWTLVTVIVWEALVAPDVTVPKSKLVGDATTAPVPLPWRDTLCGLPIALSVKVRAPTASPITVGLNVTPTVQLAPTSRLVPQVLLTMAKPAPLIAMLEISMDAVVSLVAVTVWVGLVVAISWELNSRPLGETMNGPTPLPLRATL